MMVSLRPVCGVAFALLLVGCTPTTAVHADGHASTPRPSITHSSQQATTPGVAQGASTARSAAVTKLLVFVVENKTLDQMRGQMPYVSSLANRYGYATDYHAIRHPSLPNYLAMTGGSTFGVTDDNYPVKHVARGTSVFGQALHHGKTAKLYAEGMPGTCVLQRGGNRYVVKHNPWAYFIDERASCARYDVPLTSLAHDVAAGQLPNAGMVVPNLCNDAHDCGLAVADSWMRKEIGAVLRGPDFASGHLAVVLTADEDDGSDDNRILTAVFHPSQHGNVVDTPLTSYSLARLYGQVIGAPALRKAASAPDMAAAFHLPVTRR